MLMLSNANDSRRDIDSNRAVGGETLEAVDTTERNWLKVIKRPAAKNVQNFCWLSTKLSSNMLKIILE